MLSLTPEQAEKFWSIVDTNKDGEMTVNELRIGLQNLCGANLSEKEIAQMFCDIDKSGDSIITKQEYLDEMVNRPSRAEGICKTFKDYDSSGDGKLSKDEVAKLLADSFKEKDPKEVMEDFLKYADTSNDGVITFDEFRAYFG